MKTVQKLQTRDGVIHDSVDKAKRHLTKKYESILGGIVDELVSKVQFHSKSKIPVYDILNANIDKFGELLEIIDDMENTENDDE